MALEPEVINGFFEKYEWTYQYDPPGVWNTGWRGDASSYRMFVKLTDNWIYFTIAPFVVAPKKDECKSKLYHTLLRLNRDINLAKFCLDSDGDVVMTVEMPCANLDYTEFSDAIGALCYYADDTYVELLNLATKPDAPSRYDAKAEAQEDDLDWGETKL
ncbi:MAG: YbjN domain-containing protein [Thermoflexales bacterium]|nr:YbjN domain-containing protein [Thermoflexales bacterium]